MLMVILKQKFTINVLFPYYCHTIAMGVEGYATVHLTFEILSKQTNFFYSSQIVYFSGLIDWNSGH